MSERLDGIICYYVQWQEPKHTRCEGYKITPFEHAKAAASTTAAEIALRETPGRPGCGVASRTSYTRAAPQSNGAS